MSEEKATIDAEEAAETEQDQPEEQGKEDRGDDFTPDDERIEIANDPEDDPEDPEDSEDSEDSEDDPEDSEDSEDDPEDSEEEPEPQGVPHKRVSQITREKAIVSDLADGMADGTVDPQFIRDMGGSKAVAKAIAKGDLRISDLSPGEKPVKKGEPEKSADELWDDYHQAMEDMDTAKAKDLLKAARKAERRETREEVSKDIKQAQAERDAKKDYNSAAAIFEKAQGEHSDLADAESEDYQDFTALYQGYLSGGMSYVDAVNKALKRIVPQEKSKSDTKEKESTSTGSQDNSAADETRKGRKVKALKKAAKAQEQQPESTANAAGAKHSMKLDFAHLSDAEFEKLTPAQKKRARGDEV